MKPIILLFALAFLPTHAQADLSQAPAFSGSITVTRTADGCDITLSPDKAKMLTDQIWLVVDGKSEGFGGGYYNSFEEKPVHYTGHVSSELDGNVKDILKAQGFLTKENIVTYQVSFGVNEPESGYVSKTLHFRKGSNILAFTHYPASAVYKAGDKIPIFEAVAIDSSQDTAGILGKSAEKQNQLPHDLLHRITIQVQFVPKMTP